MSDASQLPPLPDPTRKPAVRCEIGVFHHPQPVRFVWHHIQPHEAGGADGDANEIQLCDNCHYTIHRVLWCLGKGLPPPKVMRAQLRVARQGYDACVAAGTVARIPNEG
jgi:HNH endonuclease